MNNGNGFIFLHRSLLSWGWYKKPNTIRLFIHLLLMANRLPAVVHGMNLVPGQLITSLPLLSSQIGISVQQARTAIEQLKSTGEITVMSTNKFSVVTIENWAKYQACQPESTYNTTDNTTDNQQANIKKSTTNNNNRYIKNIYSPKFLEFYTRYPRKDGKADAAKAFYKIAPDEILFEKIMVSLSGFIESEDWKKDNGKFIPYPATWLNKRRWEDEKQERTSKDYNGKYRIIR